MKREQRYIVLKIKDVDEALNEEDRETLEQILGHVDAYRYVRGKSDLNCVVVESDWEEYEPTWESIEKRVDQTEATRDKVTFWDCKCGYTFHEGIVVCPKCGNKQKGV